MGGETLASERDSGDAVERPSRGVTTATVFARWLLLLMLAFGVLSLGAIHTPMLLVLAGGVAAATLLAWRSGRLRPRRSASWLVALGLGLTVYTLWQLVPLPFELVQRIAPASADAWARSLVPLRTVGPSFVPLSLDPIATRIEVLRGATYLVVLVGALRMSERRRDAEFLTYGIVAIAMLLGIAALLHPAFGAEKVFGIYRPTGLYKDRHIAPLLNSNALAAYLNIGFCLALGWTLNPSPSLPRPLALGAVVFFVTIQLWVASRGGVASMLVGALAIAWLTRGTRRQRRRGVDHILLAGALVATAGMAVFSLADQATAELTDRDLDKVFVWQDVVRMIAAHPVWGVGRGAFESTFPAFRGGTGYHVYTHPENLPLQWAAEWGLPVTFVALVLLVWTLRPSVALARAPMAVGAWGALVAVGLHNLVDFSSEYPGIVVALVVCAALVVGGRAASPAMPRRPSWSAARSLPAAVAAVMLAGLVLGASSVGRDVYSDRDALRELAEAHTSREAFHLAARETILRHPTEPYLPYAGALRAARVRDESTVPWVEGVLERARVYGPAHLLLARSLRRASPSQARLEYRLAVEQYAGLAPAASLEAAGLVGQYEDALEIVPVGKAGASLRSALAMRLTERLPATAWRLDDDILALDPHDSGAATRHASALVGDLLGAPPASWCEPNAACLQAARVAAGRVVEASPGTCEGYVLSAQVESASGARSASYELLDHAADRTTDPAVCLSALVRLAMAATDEARASSAVERLARLGCSEETACTANLLAAGDFEQQRGNRQRALIFYRKAMDRAPDDDGVAARVAEASSTLGLHVEAFDIYRRLGGAHPEDARWSQAADRERQLLAPNP